MNIKIIVTQNVQNIALVSRVFYFSLHAIALALLVYFKSPFQYALYHNDWYFLLKFIVKIIIASYFYMVCGNNPGSHYPSPLDRGDLGIEMETSSSQLPQFEKVELNKVQPQIKQIVSPLLLDSQIQSAKNSVQSSLSQNSANSEECPVPDIPEKRYCEKCLYLQPFRTKHCEQCDRCIPKYDHHCFWIGGCVGELNHRLFWLVTQVSIWQSI